MSDYPREGAHHEHDDDDETTYRPARPRATPPKIPPKGNLAPRRQMDIELQQRLGQLADDYESITDRLIEIRRALWGPEDDRQRQVEPGMVQIVHELSEASKRRAAISGALKVGITTIGVGNLILIVTVLVRLLTGSDPLP